MRLPDDKYKALQRHVLARDHWSCRVCLRRNNLHVHHIVFLSHGGSDVSANLITLCIGCHIKVHILHVLVIVGDANGKVRIFLPQCPGGLMV